MYGTVSYIMRACQQRLRVIPANPRRAAESDVRPSDGAVADPPHGLQADGVAIARGRACMNVTPGRRPRRTTMMKPCFRPQAVPCRRMTGAGVQRSPLRWAASLGLLPAYRCLP